MLAAGHGMAEDEEPELSTQLNASLVISNAELDRLIADLRTHPLAQGELRAASSLQPDKSAVENDHSSRFRFKSRFTSSLSPQLCARWLQA
jgi:hypothetical protein